MTILWRILLLVSCGQSVAHAQQVNVGTIERPPFSFHDTNGELTGFSVELWEEIALRLSVDTNWVEYQQFGDMIDDAVTGATDLAIANISIISSRESSADYSQPVFSSGMAIAVKKGGQSGALSLIWDSGILWFLSGALLLVFVIANLVWYLERGIEDARHDYFRDDYLGGVWDAFWWAFVILTMGGFEKEVPHKVLNRLLAMFWIIVSLFFISTLTAKITTALTVAELQTGIESWSDLAGKRVAVTEGSSHQNFMSLKNLPVKPYTTIDAMYAALKADEVDAIVADFPILSYQITTVSGSWMQLAGETFSPEFYGILLPERSERLEAINSSLLQLREEGFYSQLYSKYFGSP
ncbi:MAG: transporter substrate-binding domain-containing protein [Granulosicoccaceae bacterium]